MKSLVAIDTPRLRLLRPAAGDLDELCRLHRDAEVMATLGGVRSDAATAELLAQTMRHWDAHGFGFWVARDRDRGEFVGRGGLLHVAIGGRAEIEVAYALLPPFWGRGLATELAAASVRVGFTQLGLEDMVCFTLPTNHRSRRVMEKVGFRYEGDVEWKGQRHVLCRLTATEWRTGEERTTG